MSLIPRDIPEAFESERLLIRVPRPGDGAMINAAALESLEELRPWLPWASPPPTVEQNEDFARASYADFLMRKRMNLLLLLKESKELVGGSSLHHFNWEVPSFEIGYWLRTRYEGRKLMVEAVQTVAQFAFEILGARRIAIRCDARNYRSACVALGAGFVREARMRHESRAVDGSLRDMLLYARLAPETPAVEAAGSSIPGAP